MVVTVVNIEASAGKARVRISENGALCGPVPPSISPTPGPMTTPCPKAEVKMDILTDDYPAEISWNLVNTCTDEIEESVTADTKYQAQGTQYSTTYCVPSAAYRFEMIDAYGDGICCGHGSGSYSVTYDGDVKASGGEYQSLETSTFGSCDQPTNTPTNAPTRLTCENDPDWKWTNKKGKIKTCDWIAKKPGNRCKKLGVDGITYARDACQDACNDACV